MNVTFPARLISERGDVVFKAGWPETQPRSSRDLASGLGQAPPLPAQSPPAETRWAVEEAAMEIPSCNFWVVFTKAAADKRNRSWREPWVPRGALVSPGLPLQAFPDRSLLGNPGLGLSCRAQEPGPLLSRIYYSSTSLGPNSHSAVDHFLHCRQQLPASLLHSRSSHEGVYQLCDPL